MEKRYFIASSELLYGTPRLHGLKPVLAAEDGAVLKASHQQILHTLLDGISTVTSQTDTCTPIGVVTVLLLLPEDTSPTASNISQFNDKDNYRIALLKFDYSLYTQEGYILYKPLECHVAANACIGTNIADYLTTNFTKLPEECTTNYIRDDTIIECINGDLLKIAELYNPCLDYFLYRCYAPSVTFKHEWIATAYDKWRDVFADHLLNHTSVMLDNCLKNYLESDCMVLPKCLGDIAYGEVSKCTSFNSEFNGDEHVLADYDSEEKCLYNGNIEDHNSNVDDDVSLEEDVGLSNQLHNLSEIVKSFGEPIIPIFGGCWLCDAKWVNNGTTACSSARELVLLIKSSTHWQRYSIGDWCLLMLGESSIKGIINLRVCFMDYMIVAIYNTFVHHVSKVDVDAQVIVDDILGFFHEHQELNDHLTIGDFLLDIQYSQKQIKIIQLLPIGYNGDDLGGLSSLVVKEFVYFGKVGQTCKVYKGVLINLDKITKDDMESWMSPFTHSDYETLGAGSGECNIQNSEQIAERLAECSLNQK